MGNGRPQILAANAANPDLYGVVVHQEGEVCNDLLDGGAVAGDLLVAEGEEAVFRVVVQYLGVVFFFAGGHKEFYALQGWWSPREIWWVRDSLPFRVTVG